jgi:hypothetical protein
VFGSPNFREGQRFETSPIVKGSLENGSVVTTESGSRYFLSGKTVAEMKEETKKSTPPLPKELIEALPGATIELTLNAKEKAVNAAMDELNKAKSDVTISLSSLFGFDRSDQKESSASATKMKMKTTQARKSTLAVKPTKNAPKPKAQSSPSQPTPSPPKTSKPPIKRPTFSLSDLFGTGGPSSTTASTKTKLVAKPPQRAAPKPKVKTMNKTVVKKKVKKSVSAMKDVVSPPSDEKLKTAPSGVPTIVNWRRNNDRSVTGFIKGSKSFSDGEKVTTSPIANGVIRRGELVISGSGSKYFLQ